MNLRQMEVFRAVMLTGGVGGAAELLHVSQPAVSKVLAQARRKAGFLLFERVKGRLVPTPEAQRLHEEVEALWRGVERVRNVSRALAAPSEGTLRLAVTASLATHLVPHTLASLAEQFPGLDVQVEILIPPLVVTALLDRTADLGVALQPAEHPNLSRVQSYRCGFSCVMREDHPMARRASVLPAHLRGQRLITSPPDTPYGQALRRAYGAQASSLQLHAVVRSSTSACWLAQAGGGVAVVDRATVSGDNFRGLAVRPFRTPERLAVGILRNRYRPLSVLQKAFCTAFAATWAQDMPEA